MSTRFPKPPTIQPSQPRIIEVATSLQPAAHSARPAASPPKPGPGRKRNKRWLVGSALVVCAVAGFAKYGKQVFRDGPAAPVFVSGKADLKKTPTGKYQRWRKQHVQVKIDSSVDRLGKGARDAIASGFHSWGSAGITLPDVSFGSTTGAKLSSTPDGVSTILVAPIDIPGHTNDLAVTIAFSDPSTGEIVEADVVINAKHKYALLAQDAEDPNDETETPDDSESPKAEPKSGKTQASSKTCITHLDGARCGSKYDVQNVMTHEAGHFFGLSEDFKVTTATMYECISACETHKRALTADDEQAVTELYAEGFSAADQQPEAAGCGGAHVTPHTNAGLGGLAASVFSVGAIAGLRRRSRRRAATSGTR